MLNLTGILFGLLLAASSAAQAVAWRTDFDNAKREAAAAGQLLFVAFTSHGDESAAQMQKVYDNVRVASALAATKVVVACSFNDEQAAEVSMRYGDCAEALRNGERAARHFLFGSRTVVANQQVVLFPDGAVAWHNPRTCSVSKMLGALRTATARLRRSPQARRQISVRNAAKLTRRARADSEAYFVLVTELRHSPDRDFWKKLPTTRQYRALSERLLRDVTKDLPLHSGAQLMAMEVPGELGPIAQMVGNDIERQRQKIHAKLPSDGSLPDLGPVAELDGVVFTDGVDRRIDDGANRVTVLWFFLPDHEALQCQIAAVEPVAAGLAAQGVRVLGLGASLEPEKEAGTVRRARLPFPAAPYLYDHLAARAGVRMFPSAVVLDRKGAVVFRSNQSMDLVNRKYDDFAVWVRALLAKPLDQAQIDTAQSGG